jgi:hypothetical protein
MHGYSAVGQPFQSVILWSKPSILAPTGDQTSVGGVFAYVCDFLLPLPLLANNMVETLIQPKRSPPAEQLVDTARRIAFYALEDRLQWQPAKYSKDKVHMVGHYYGRIEIQPDSVPMVDGRHHNFFSRVGKKQTIPAAKGHEVCGLRSFQVGQMPSCRCAQKISRDRLAENRRARMVRS